MYAPLEPLEELDEQSAEELDKELDAFMKDDAAPAATVPAPSEDVEMKA